jgi:PAS domain S-box-containing protein
VRSLSNTVRLRNEEVGEPAGTGRSALAQILAQQAAVAAIGQRALSEHRLEVLLAETTALVGRVLQTELVDVLELAPDRQSLKIVAGIGWRPGVVGKVVVPAGTGSQSGYTLSTGGPVIVSDLSRETRFKIAPVLQDHGAASGMSVRIGDMEQPYGVLAAFTERPGHFTRDDANFLQSVANVLAGAIGRMRMETELRRSRDQLAAIVGSVDDGIVVQAADDRLIFANDAAARMTGFPTGADLVAASPSEILARYELLDTEGRPLPPEALPGRRAMAGEITGETLVQVRILDTGEQRWAEMHAKPVPGEDGAIAQVITVFRDVTEQKRAERSRRFLTDALAAVAGTLHQAEAARLLADLCVSELADYCVVDLLDADGSIETVAVAHATPERAELGWRLSRMRPLSRDDETGPARVMRDRQPEFMARITPQVIAAEAKTETEEAIHRQLGLRSRVCVPLVARGRTIGALTLATAGSGRLFLESDLRLAEELGARAGIALENARLYEIADDRRAELDAVLAAMAEAVLVFDPRGRLRLSNRAAQRLFERDVPQTVEALRERLAPGGPNTVGHDAAAADMSDLEGEIGLSGSGRWLEVRRYRAARRAADQGTRHAPQVVVLRDVTDARAARSARDAFLGVLSHELRTPITTIYGGTELLERGLEEPRRAEVIRDVRAESERLARLIEDLLVMTRVERGGVEIGDEPVLLQRLLPGLASSLASRWPGLEIEVELAEGLPAVGGDATYLEQVVRNLLTNAVRYGDAIASGMNITACVQEGEVLVSVLDSGPGIEGDEAERLFELFYRAPSAKGVPGGAGIGLFVCRHLVEAMGGRIWARARPEGGAEFGFALPIIEPDAG